MVWSSRCGFELNWFNRRRFGRVGCFRVRFVLFTFLVSCVLASSFCVLWNWEEWIASFRSSRENNEDRLLNHLVRTTDEDLTTLRSLVKNLESILNRSAIREATREYLNRFSIDQQIRVATREQSNRFSIDQQSEWQPESNRIDSQSISKSEWQPESNWIDSQSISNQNRTRGPMNRFSIDWGATELQILSDGMIRTVDSFKWLIPALDFLIYITPLRFLGHFASLSLLSLFPNRWPLSLSPILP